MESEVATTGGEAQNFSPVSIEVAAGALGREAYQELQSIRPPKDYKMVPQITVTLTYRLEKKP
jgi:hypothetical protein